MQFLSIVAFVGAQYRLTDRHSSYISDGSRCLSSRSPATAIVNTAVILVCPAQDVNNHLQYTRSYPENRINGLPQIYHARTWWLTISNNQAYTMPLPQEEAATKV